MRIRFFIFILIAALISSTKISAQQTKTVELKPIVKQGWKYYYDGRKVKTVNALQIPLEALNDNEINERMRKFRRLQVIGSLAYLPALVYLFTYNHPSSYHSRTTFVNTYITLAIGGMAGSIAFNALAHHQMAKAVDIYNIKIVGHNSIGLTINSLPEYNYPSVSYSFKF